MFAHFSCVQSEYEKHDASGASLSFQILQSAEVKQQNDHTNYANYRHHGDDCRDVTLPEI